MLGWHREWFGSQVRAAVGASDLAWLDFPSGRQARSYPGGVPIREGEWERLNFIADDTVQKKFDLYWPKQGSSQNWDAIGRATVSGESTWLLIEAKAHLAEVSRKGTDAKELGGRPLIRRAFIETLRMLGHSEAEAARFAEIWLQGFYQHANRLATLQFLQREGIPARLIHVYFYGDQHSTPKRCPAKPEEWQPLLREIHEELGLTGHSTLEERVHEIFVDVDAV